jgi:solute carrier family 25 citrate transporter 1
MVGTAGEIIKNESPLGLYRGLGAVIGGIIPKMAIRFTSYEYYKRLLSDRQTMEISRKGTFIGMVYPTQDNNDMKSKISNLV